MEHIKTIRQGSHLVKRQDVGGTEVIINIKNNKSNGIKLVIRKGT